MRLGGQEYLRCDAAAYGTCRNRRTIRRDPLEAHVMELLARQLMQPELVAEFIQAYHLEWQRLVGEMRFQADTRQREHAALDRKIGNLVDAVADGRGSKALLAKLAEYEAQRERWATCLSRPPCRRQPRIRQPAISTPRASGFCPLPLLPGMILEPLRQPAPLSRRLSSTRRTTTATPQGWNCRAN